MNIKDGQAIASDFRKTFQDMERGLNKYIKQHPQIAKHAKKQQSFNYKDGYGEELSVVINPSNGFLLATDDVSGDSVAMAISFSELRRLAKIIDDEVPHGKVD
ncbi:MULTISPECIES: hypothetical protein [Lactiplantibacillus]|uniref:Uncharacterized protein n=3 Tax=Lactiplantibacillus pentosus TaxID=1589 RepID=A0AAP5PY63_LACPE|nr:MULTISPECIES: hypothetical protein [Lactiplantibacillus]MBU7449029.1 hypothetical protein [Lactiplantibacillus sp. 7.2.4]MBU7461208.1 hypothetical protein [Lactiplantibacillus pentosus]MBU7474616.1 hypothetical protein [Lactiplantibacillus pentosus]MBU7476950.1 hypothetical protein [Lactiplantibacillus pentosus]MBU7483874.1 hypothetical protein [Lactiplantibacillus sp. 30.2.29]